MLKIRSKVKPMIQMQNIARLKDAGDLTFLASAVAALTANLPWVILVLTTLYGVGRLYLLWLEIKLKRKALKEDNAPADRE